MTDFIVGTLHSFTAEDAEHATEQFYDTQSPHTLPDVNVIVESGDLEELGRVIRFLIPTADWAEDNDGQLIIYTNLRIDENGDLVVI